MRENAPGDWRGEDDNEEREFRMLNLCYQDDQMKEGEMGGGMQHIWGREENTDLITRREETVLETLA